MAPKQTSRRLPSTHCLQVVDVIAARTSRVVLLTDKHIAYLYAKQVCPICNAGWSSWLPNWETRQRGQGTPPWIGLVTIVLNVTKLVFSTPSTQNVHTAPDGSNETSVTYKIKWIIQNSLVDNIRGVEKTYRISIEYRKPISVRRINRI